MSVACTSKQTSEVLTAFNPQASQHVKFTLTLVQPFSLEPRAEVYK